ncbi:long chain base stimulates phosphorylation, partial [Rhizodiscina lignyota]
SSYLQTSPRNINRSLSIRSNKNSDSVTSPTSSGRHRFIPSLRGSNPELSRRLAKLVKSENHVITAYENAGKEQQTIARQLSEWGEQTGDDAVSEVADKLGVLLAEMADQEDFYAQGLEESRTVLKQIRNTESSVQPSRDHKAKIQDEIQKLKYKEPASPKIVQLEQELVRAEAQSLVAEAQLTNITRQKLRQAYDLHLKALLERSAKQTLLATQARRVLALLDDTPIVPGETRPPFGQEHELRQILSDAEEELRGWQPGWEEL